jgi:hypothetical protein
MSIKDCISLLKTIDPDDAAAVRRMQSGLVASGVPGDEAYTQAAELVMEEVLEERNALADEITEQGGFLDKLDIENLLNPASYLPAAETGTTPEAPAGPEDTGVAEPKPEYKTTRRKKTKTDLRNEIPGLRAIWSHLTPEERKKLRRDSSARLVDMFKNMPDAKEMAAVAYSGRAKRGWYNNSARAILQIFGAEDAPRFAALLAALSPQTSVEQNLENAISVWTLWISAGGINRKRDRPTDKFKIDQILASGVAGKRGQESVLDAWRNNVHRALTAEFPEDLVISGPKVNSFMLNLRGVVNEVTNDTWMANYALLDPKIFGGKLTKGGDPGKGSAYLAMSALVRKAAKIVSQRTGETWTPMEVQETIWSWAKTVYEKANQEGENRTVVELIKSGALQHEDIADAVDFERLFVQGVYRNLLGYDYDQQLAELERSVESRGQADVGDGITGDATSPEGSGISEDAFSRHLRRAGRRLEKRRQERLAEEKRKAEEKAAAEGKVEEGGAEYPISPGPRRSPDSVRENKDRRRDVLTAGGISGEAAQAQAADTFHALYEAREVATVQSGVDHIKSHGDMAHLVAAIRKHAQETFFVAITDSKGKILNVIRHSIGTRDGASVYPIDIVGAIAATKGAKRYWLAHNHPSGVREPSNADQRITETIQAHTVGMPVRYMGHVIIGDTRYGEAMGAQPDSPIPAYARRKKVPTTEFKLKRRAINDMVVLTRPAETMGVVRTLESESGIILLDNRNRINGVLGLTTEEMSKLRDGKQVRRILSGIAKSNAAAMIGFNKAPGGRAALENLSNYFSHISASTRVLDMIGVADEGHLYAFSEQGLDVGTDKRPFNLISRETAGPAKLDKTRQMRQVKRWLSTPVKRLGGRVPIVWMHHPSEAPFQSSPLAAGATWDGKAYLFTDNIRDQKEAIKSLEHEAIGHLGLEGALGHKKFAELLGDVLNLRVEMLMDPSAHPEIAKIVAELKQHYVDEKGKYILDAREEAREILAHIVHSKPRLGVLREIYNKVVAWMKEWAAKVGLADPDMAHIESLIVAATDTVLSPGFEVTADREKPAAIINQPPPDDPSDPEYYRKLGLGGDDTRSLIRKMTDLKWGGIREAVGSSWGRAYEGLFDGLIEIKRAERRAGVGLGKETTYLTPKGVEKKTVDYEGSAYVAARLATGVADMMTHLLHWGSLKWEGNVVGEVQGTRGFLQVLGELGQENLKDWLIWMAGNRANELWTDNPDTNRERNLTREEIDQAMTHNRGKEELFEKIRKEYMKMNKLQLDFAQEAGLINPEKRAEWESEWYVPFYRQTDEDRSLGPHTTRGLSHQSAGLRRLMGAKLPTADLLENIMTNWIKLTDASVKNHALRQMIDNFQDTDERQLGYLSDETAEFKKALIPKNEIHKLLKQDKEFAARLAEWLDLDPKTTADGIWDAVADLDSSGFEVLWQVVAPKDPDIVRLQRNGKNEYYRVHVPGLLRAVGSMTPVIPKGKLMRASMGFKQMLTLLVTASPDFMLRNFIRDAAHSWAINKDNMWFLSDSLKGLKGAWKADPMHRAMMAAGASFQGGYVHGTDPKATANIMRRELVKSGLSEGEVTKFLNSIVDTPGKLTKVIGSGWQHYREAGDRIENASRVATAAAGMKAGKPKAQWLFESKDLMDYSRRGNFSALIAFTDVMPFLNARIQGMDKLGRATAADPLKVAGKAAWIAGFSIMVAMMNDDDEDYQALPDWEKDAYWHLYPPDANGKKHHVRIPKPFEIGFIAATMPERMYRAWYSKTQPSEKVIWALHHGFRETLNISIYPQIILPVTEVYANRHFYFDQPIESMADKNVLSQYRYNQYTSETAMAAGDTALAKWLELSPKQLQHLWNGYTGTLGAYALGATDMLLTRPLGDFPSPEAKQLEDYPLIKAIYRGDRKRTSQWQVDFYDRLQEVRELHGSLRKHITEGNRKLALEIQKENREKLAVRRGLEAVQKTFSKLRKRREQILMDDRLTGAEKYQKSQAIQAQINALAKKIEQRTRDAFSD